MFRFKAKSTNIYQEMLHSGKYSYLFSWGDAMDFSKDNTIFIKLHYEGMQCNDHVIELAPFAKSLQGFSKLSSNIGGLVSGNPNNVKIFTGVNVQKGSVVVDVAIQVMSGVFVQASINLFSLFLKRYMKKGYINRIEIENEVLKLEQEKRDKKNNEFVNSIRDCYGKSELPIDLCYDLAIKFFKNYPKLKAPGKDFLNTIENNCNSIQAKIGNEELFNADVITQRSFKNSDTKTETVECNIVLKKLDKENGVCSLYVDGDKTPISASIVDINFSSETNEYLDSFANRSEYQTDTLRVMAQKRTNEEGKIVDFRIISIVHGDNY